jgi:hypothetical protein
MKTGTTVQALTTTTVEFMAEKPKHWLDFPINNSMGQSEYDFIIATRLSEADARIDGDSTTCSARATFLQQFK